MKIAISGSSGFIGRKLFDFLSIDNEVIKINRSDFKKNDDSFSKLIENCNVIINLVGAPIIKRWTKSYIRELYTSRLDSVDKFTRSIKLLNKKPSHFLNASAVGIYTSNDKVHTEIDYTQSNNLLGDLVSKWEESVKILENEAKVKTTIMRFGVVLSKTGGALEKMIFPFKLGLGSIVGNGKQPMPWISINDLKHAVKYVIDREIYGVINFVNPSMINNREFSKALARAVNSFLFLKTPEFVFKLLFGSGSIVLTEGQKVKPYILLKEGFIFQDQSFADFLEKEMGLK
ncbi:MAG: TIGR01777 family oxidoreductase [Candidatus Delongbacteria bacterium]|nr:TIGR01777 family oxidoreductase [Candidatus Delongbacteria bacterium]MBN2833940.1 TIGR01777 family oxidoreductase [Candidatus Delongbacteria bacterium]